MIGFKIFAAAALVCAVAGSTFDCVAPTVTVTIASCNMPPPAIPATQVTQVPKEPESTATAPLSTEEPHESYPHRSQTDVVPAPSPPVSSGAPAVPTSSVAPGTTAAPSSTAANQHGSSSASGPPALSTAGAAPLFGLGSLAAVGAAAMAIVA